MMDQNGDDGPDGSSLAPFSALRARFEASNKPADAPPIASKPLSRPISPAPKPDKLRDLNFKPTQDGPPTPSTPTTPVVPSRPKPKPALPPPMKQVEPEPADTDAPPVPPPSSRPKPAVKPLAPKPEPPSVTIQPPQSPPKSRISTLLAEEKPAFLNPDSVTSPITPGGGSFKPPTRPTTPTPAPPPPRSPRGSRPPSPPPPRRSGELKREPKQPPPPPAPRREKNLVPEPPSAVQTTPKKHDVSNETSPFSSPPSSPGTDGEEAPPQLPTRPRPQVIAEPPPRPRSAFGTFEPPPVHPTVARRRDRATDSPTNGYQAQQSNGDLRPGSLPKPQTFDAPPQRPISMQAPPRPQRAADPRPEPQPSKRVSSNPATQNLPLPPTRTHGRSKTMDGANDRQPMEDRPQPQAAAPSKALITPGKTEGGINTVTTYPDSSLTNRKPPVVMRGIDEISAKYDPRIFDVCGELVCTSGQMTRLWNLQDGDMLMSLMHTEGIKATAIAFKPAADPKDEGSSVWVGTNQGELMEIDLFTHQITPSKGSVHQRREIIRIYRHYNELWTLDELGTLHVWGPGEDGVPELTNNPHQSYKMPREHTFSMVVGDELWHATGKEIRVFAPTLDGRTQFQVLIRPLFAEGAGDVTSGTLVKTHQGKAFFGHSDGKISIFSTTNYACLSVLNISTWKMNALAGVGHRIWVGYNTGKICVYDINDQPWSILKEWQAHTNPVIAMKCDPAGAYRMDRLQVVSLGADNRVRIWDGLMQEDWVEDEMKSRDTEYCDFDELSAMVFTWNAGASTPSSLRHSPSPADQDFFRDLIGNSGAPDILVFGFQELVDLEDKTATAKRFLKVKKKNDGDSQQNMAHQYRDWKNFLVGALDNYMPKDELYQLLHTAPMVGLFTCVFVKADVRARVRNLNGAEVKRGMGGLHGNKGAVAVRFQIDDSSICFVNCHLAAGQSQANARHNDVAEILETAIFPPQRNSEVQIDSFTGGGDGSLVLDHELCVLNGDLNYRIDTMSRDTVVQAVKHNNLPKLLDRDQLLVARRRNPAFRLRAFEELPITFAPTYKYDVGTDRYDTSEKRRSPAWCDRLLFRGRGRVQQLDYQRHEVYVSDHRPVTGNFKFWVKSVRDQDRASAWSDSQQKFEAYRQKNVADEKFHYLTKFCGYDEATSKQLIKEKTARKVHRSPSRGRDAY